MTVIALSLAASAGAQDRYGAAPSSVSGAPAGMPMLSWPGKTAAPRQVIRPRQASVPVQATPAAPTSLYDPPPPRWRAAGAAPAVQSPAPSADAPAPAEPVQPALSAQQIANGAPPRRYSLARQYGVEPDPIALSPQFLASSPQPDMADPPPLPPQHLNAAQTANMSAAAATSQLRQAQEAASDADAASLGN